MKWITTAMAALALMGSALAQQKLYDGTRALGDQNIAVEGWGSGIITETTEASYEGSSSLRISTRNFFQGGSIKFNSGVKLTDAYTNRSNLLMFVLRVASSPTSGNTSPAGGPGTGASGGGGQVGDEGGGPGGNPRGGQSSSIAQNPPGVDHVRVVITTTDGLRSEAYLDLSDTMLDQRGWRRAGIPLQAISGFDRTNKEIAAISLSADEATTFYVGSIQIVEDSTPIMVEIPMGDLNIGTGDTVVFRANAQGGATRLIYEWDFDDKDGIQVDAEGRAVRHRFRNPGTYTVTVTVRDAYGLKEPAKRTLTVTVN